MARDEDTRQSRELENRSNEERKKKWAPPTVLPEPNKADGYSYRWIRTAAFGQVDNTNVSAKFREGWEPVKIKEHPELQLMTDPKSNFPDNVEIGGLLLCRTASENMDMRSEYYDDKAKQQVDSVDQNYMRENDPRMPLLKPEKRTRVDFGRS
jgi:hypothetical protein